MIQNKSNFAICQFLKQKEICTRLQMHNTVKRSDGIFLILKVADNIRVVRTDDRTGFTHVSQSSVRIILAGISKKVLARVRIPEELQQGF
jgi:hypothetical protein